MFIKITETGAEAPQDLIDAIAHEIVAKNIPFSEIYIKAEDIDEKKRVVAIKNVFGANPDPGTASLSREAVSDESYQWLQSLPTV